MRLVSVFCVLLSLPILGGCVAAVAGGAAGGYYIGKDERSVGRIIDDGVITSRVNLAFMNDELISVLDVNVDTMAGEVYLYGDVLDSDEKERITS